jgi:hypothetical protein
MISSDPLLPFSLRVSSQFKLPPSMIDPFEVSRSPFGTIFVLLSMSTTYDSADTRPTSLENGTSRSSDDTYVSDHQFDTWEKKEARNGTSIASVEIPDGGWAAWSTVAGG